MEPDTPTTTTPNAIPTKVHVDGRSVYGSVDDTTGMAIGEVISSVPGHFGWQEALLDGRRLITVSRGQAGTIVAVYLKEDSSSYTLLGSLTVEQDSPSTLIWRLLDNRSKLLSEHSHVHL